MKAGPATHRGRGASANPANRFAKVTLERDADWNPEEDISPRTQLIADASASVITYNDSPDIGFDASINVYRGCEHGCAYCYARPYHEYLGYPSAQNFYGLDILPFAVEIAKVTMMIARKLAIDELHISEQPLPLDPACGSDNFAFAN